MIQTRIIVPVSAGIDPSMLPVRARLVTTEAEFAAVMYDHRRHLGVIQRALDERIGWPDGYAQKLETLIRHSTRRSHWEWLAGLDLGIRVEPVRGR